jgi:ElaB/YqjD/DUF883 family membrane-anchored ribosome-binding protein
MFTSKDFENMGKAAAMEYVRLNKPLNDSIVKIAENYGLNSAQIARVVEQANVETYLKLNKTAADKYVEFPPASIKEISSKLELDIKKEAALVEDFDNIDISEDYTIESNLLPEDLERLKQAETKTLEKIAKHINQFIEKRLEEIDESFSRESDNLYKLVKQAALETGKYDLVKYAMIEAVPDNSSGLIADVFKEKLKKEAAGKIDFDSIEKPIGKLNKEHPIVQTLQKMAILKEEYLTIKDLQKESAGKLGPFIGNALTTLGKGIRLGTSGSWKALKYVSKHPAIPGAAAALAGAASLGVAKGRSESAKSNIKVRRDYVERGENLKPL